MDYKITVRVEALEKVIDIPWTDVEKDYLEFISKTATSVTRPSFLSSFKIVESRIRCVFLDRCKKSLVQ
jgi:hypothetical protein